MALLNSSVPIDKVIRTIESNTRPGGGGGGAATIADGANVVEGAVADAATSAGAAGTISAKLRKVTTDTDSIATVTGATGDSVSSAGGAGTLSAKLRLLTGVVKNEDTASADADPMIVIAARRAATPADTSGTDGDYESLQIKDGKLWTRSAPSVNTPTTSQVSVTNSSTTLASALAGGQIVSISNNGLTTIWVRPDGSAPVADTATFPARNGDGLGIEVTPGSTWETPRPVTTAIKGIVQTGTVKATVDLYPI